MKKIPTIFVRDERGQITDECNPACLWVFKGDGYPTRKYDGSCCMLRDGKLWKRREVKKGKPAPVCFLLEEFDETTGKRIGWVPVGDGPEDKFFRDAWSYGMVSSADPVDGVYPIDGTYELCGPKVQGNPEGFDVHRLVRHGTDRLPDTDRMFDSLKTFLAGRNIEGIVYWHEDGKRKAKIKGRDFGLTRTGRPK